MVKHSEPHAKNFRQYRWVLVIVFVAFLSLGTLYAINTSNHYLREESTAALNLVSSTAQLIAADADTRQHLLQERLIRFVNEHSHIARAYIYTYTTESITIIADSEPENPMRPRLEPIDRPSVLSKAQVLKQDDFIHVRAPIANLVKDQTIPVLGVDFYIDDWMLEANKHLRHALAVLALIALFLIAFYQMIKQNLLLRESERSKMVFLSHLPGMAYRCENDEDWTMLYVSPGCQPLTGYTPEALLFNRDLSFNELIPYSAKLNTTLVYLKR